MNSTWSPYNQQSFLGGGESHLPLPPSHEDSLSRYGGGSSLLPGLSSVPSRSNIDSAPLLPNSDYESLIPSSMQSAKEPVKFYNDSMFSELCNRKSESQSTIQNFTCSESQNDSTFPSDKYVGPVPSVNYPPPPPANPDSSSPFGVLPHLEVKSPVGRSDKILNDSYIPPVHKPPFSNGAYADRESSNKHPPVSSVQSPYSCDTSLSPANVNSLNSSNFSSPTEFYSSPKTNFGAYKSLQSPMPQSPSVAQHSYPSSPFTNIDSGCHISPAPPCSPMNGGTYVNSLNGVPPPPPRNGQKSQHSPNNSAGTANMLLYNTPQSQSMSHHRSASALSRTSDYHSDYNMYSLDQNSPTSYSSIYPTVHRGQMCNGNRPQLSPRGHVNLQNEVLVPYGQPRSIPPPISSPTYLQPKVSPDTLSLSSCSSSMRPPIYMSCSSMNTIKTEHYPLPSPGINNLENNKYPYSSSDLIEVVNDQEALEMFNSHVDSGAHSHELTNSLSNFLEDELGILDTTTALTNRQLRSAKTNDCHQPNRIFSHSYGNGNMLQRPISSEQPNGELTGNADYSYSSSFPQPIRMRNSTSPKRRGRRGRRRGGNVVSFGSRGRGRGRREYPNIDPILTSQILELDPTQPKVPSLVNYHPQFMEQWKICDEKRLSSISSFYSHLSSDNQKLKDMIPKILNTEEVRQEVMHLTMLPIPPRRVTRNHTKYESPFVACYLKFASQRNLYPGEVWPPRAQEEQKSKSKHKKKQGLPGDELKIRFQKVTLDSSRAEWRCLRGSREHPLSVSDDDDSESASKSSFEMLSSHEIKQEYDSEAEETGNLSTVTENRSAKRNTVVCNETEMHLNVTNSDTLPAGKLQVKYEREEVDSSSKEEEMHEMPKQSLRKCKKIPPEEIETNIKSENLSGISTDLLCDSSATTTKVEAASGETSSKRRLSLRNRGTESAVTETETGTVKDEAPESSSDHFENFDDSDSDPAWTPVAKAAKAGEITKPVGAPPRKRIHKAVRKASTFSNLPAKRKRAQSKDACHSKKKTSTKSKMSPGVKKGPIATSSRPKRETTSDRFLIAKADINHPTPYIWKIDKKSSMLQRFEMSEQNGVLLYRSSFTYAAGNEISVSNYVTADVRVKSPDTVQYLGPNLTDAAALQLSKEMSRTPLVKENFEYLKDDFIVYIQSLLSQDVDSSFLQEIDKFNDEYFLVPIKNLDGISEEKKKNLLKYFWCEDLKKSVNTYPRVNILDSGIDSINCYVCNRIKGTKFLQFFGQPYDSLTLGPVEIYTNLKTQFSACDNCSYTVLLYNQLHHYKYNLFTKCRSKATEVKANNNNLESHEDVLKLCLEDTPWIEKMFLEQTTIWHDCNRNS